MISKKTNYIKAVLFIIFISINSYAHSMNFFGMMNNMISSAPRMPQMMLQMPQIASHMVSNSPAIMFNLIRKGPTDTAVTTMLSFCENGNINEPIDFYTTAMNIMGPMQPFANMTETNVVSYLLKNRNYLLRSLECSKNSPKMVRMLINSFRKNFSLSYILGHQMITSRRVANSVLDLGLNNRELAKFLLKNIDITLYQQITLALISHKNSTLILKLLEIIERESSYVFNWNTKFMRTFTSSGSVKEPHDGVELANQRFLYATFSNYKATVKFMKIMRKINNKNDVMNLMNFIFLGKNWYKKSNKWISFSDNNLAYYHIFAMLDGMMKQAKLNKNSKNLERMFQIMAQKFFILPKSKNFSPFGKNMIKAMIAGSKSDSKLRKFSTTFMNIMKIKKTNLKEFKTTDVPLKNDYFKKYY